MVSVTNCSLLRTILEASEGTITLASFGLVAAAWEKQARNWSILASPWLVAAAFLKQARNWSILASLWLVAALFAPAPASELDSHFPIKPFQIVYKDAETVQATFTETLTVPQTFNVQKWTSYIADPPVTDSQKDVSALLRVATNPQLVGKRVTELSPLRRPVLFMNFENTDPSIAHALTVEGLYAMRIYPRRLIAGAAPHAARPLTAEERSNALRESDNLDFHATAFREFLKKQKLLRAVDESDVDFAWRTFRTLRALYAYNFQGENMDRQASHVCRLQQSDCGGLAGLFVATLRANAIPARLLVGKWAKSDHSGAPGGIQQCHVKSEFYAESVGWVPVEISGSIENKLGRDLDFFGNEYQPFITLHLDVDLVLDSVMFGEKSLLYLQNAATWYYGTGSGANGASRARTWIVKK